MQDSLQQHDYGPDAFLYMAQFFQEPQPAPYTDLELAGQRVVQQSELFDRSLPHGFHKMDRLVAIPHPQYMRDSFRHYNYLIDQEAWRLGVSASEVRREARSYAASRAYDIWLRENAPA